MKLTYLRARNIAGFENFELVPGDVNVISGRNKTGKSSLLDVILCGLGAGDDEELLRVGSEDGEILLKLEEGGEAWEVRRALVAGIGKDKIRIKSSRTGNVGAVKAFITQIADTVSMDPLRRALRASPKEQTEILLKTLPLDVDPREIQEAAGNWPFDQDAFRKGVEVGVDALTQIQRIADAIYDRRTGVNRVKEDKERTVRELEATLPPTRETNSDGALNTLNRRQAEIGLEIAAIEGRAATVLGGLKDELQTTFEKQKHLAEAIAQAEIDAIRKRLAEGIEELHSRLLQDVNKGASQAAATVQRVTAELFEEQRENAAEISRLEEVAKAETRAAAQREIIQRTRTEAAQSTEESSKLTNALENLRALKLRLLERIPIKGLEFKDGKPWLDGVPLHRANTAEQIKFWARIAAMRAGPLGIVCFDDAEHLDDVNFPLLVNAAKDWCQRKPGLQFFITKVEATAFKIEVL